MRTGPVLVLWSLLVACCGGCLIIPIPYLHPTFIPEHELLTTDDVIVTKTVVREKHRMAGVPCIPYETEERCVALVELSLGKTPGQKPQQIEFFNFIVAPSMLMMLPLPGYVWEHDTVALQVYRRGYQTITIQNWQNTPLNWVPVNSLAEREIAIDNLLFEKQANWVHSGRNKDAAPLDGIENQSWFDQKKDRCFFEKENTEQEKKEIQRTLRRVADEYQVLEYELQSLPEYQQQHARVASKRKQLLCLGDCLTETSTRTKEGQTRLPSFSRLMSEVAIGSPLDIQLASSILHEAGVNHCVNAEGSLYIYVAPADYDTATSLLLKQTQFTDRIILRQPSKMNLHLSNP